MNFITRIITMLALCVSMHSSAQGLKYRDQIYSESDIQIIRNVAYGYNFSVLTNTNDSLRMDLYQPSLADTATARPVVIYLHDGDFLPPVVNGTPLGDKGDSTAVNFCKRLAERGYVAISINYRLGWNPVTADADVRKGTYLQALFRAMQDTKNAVRYLNQGYATTNPLHINPSQITIFGEGTGGTIALALGTLDNFNKIINLPKFRDSGTSIPYIDSTVIGNVDGFGGTYNMDNYRGYSANVQFIANAGGSLIDTSWLEAGQAPMVSFHAVRDPLAPYGNGVKTVTLTNENILDVSGSGIFMPMVNSLGNNAAFSGFSFNDDLSLIARSKYNLTVPYILPAPYTTISTGYGEGLFPFILPLNATKLNNQSAPWQFWDPTSPQATAIVTGSNPQVTTNDYSLQSNADMSSAKSARYIDTMQGYLLPRLMVAFQLPNYQQVGAATTATSVWPGDANNDGVVDANDALQIGIEYGSTGFARTNASLVWIGQPTLDWSTVTYGINDKHADSNGDGIIDATDTIAVSQNYTLTHSKTSDNKAQITDPVLSLVAIDDSIEPGKLFHLKITLGNSSVAVDSLYGIAFKINLDATIFDAGSAQLTLSNSWLGTGSNAFTFRKANQGIDMVLSRTDHTNASGNGQIGELSIKALPILSGNVSDHTVTFIPVVIKAITAGGTAKTFNTQSTTANITGIADNALLESFDIYPNPSTGHFVLSIGQASQQLNIEVLNVQGQSVYSEQMKDTAAGKKDLNFISLSKGIYFLKVSTNQSIGVKRIIID